MRSLIGPSSPSPPARKAGRFWTDYMRSDDGSSEPGNPVIFDAALRDEWLAGAADLACRRWRLAHPERVRWLETDNRRYRIDIDTPEDIERFAAKTGHALSWPAALAESR